MEKILDVAQYIYQELKNTLKFTDEEIDEMKIHKLLYFAQRESYAIINQPLFKEELEAWKYGPVNRIVRASFIKGMGFYDPTKEISPESMYIVKNVILEYGKLNSWELSEITHKEQSWINARIGLKDGENGSNIICKNDIKKDSEKIRPYDHLYDMYYDEFEDCDVL
ncbi:MAG: Panacea domain-containing protein [Fusobacterium sp.]|uniref:Panacea domain-containing protein n=1 Tax=Fusobacterium sp. TaxID=68766 RepID=UPI0039928D7D